MGLAQKRKFPFTPDAILQLKALTCKKPSQNDAPLREATEILQNANLEAGFVHSPLGLGQGPVLGIIAVDDIIAFYKDR